MKSSSKSLAMASVLFAVSAGGCALIGYDLSVYQSTTSTGGGSSGSSGGEGGAGPSAASSGGAGPSSASTTASTSSGTNCPNNCNDNNHCTQDICDANDTCTNPPIPIEDDNNACTTDGCDPATGPTHVPLEICCPHSLCVTGAPLKPGCNPPHILESCVSNICLAEPLCCSKTWDAGCVELVPQYCTGKDASNTVITCGACAHSYCMAGGPLDPTCDPCVYAISVDTPSCVKEAWTADCVELTHSRCGIPRDVNCQ